MEAEILLVEDQMSDAELCIRVLEKSGFANKIYHVKDGAEALDFIHCKGNFASRRGAAPPKIVLLDLNMPKVSGMTVLEAIKSDPITKSIVVIILTCSNEDPDMKRCYELGANTFIVKPVGSENIFRVIKRLGMYWKIVDPKHKQHGL